jgi:hypothetical protein
MNGQSNEMKDSLGWGDGDELEGLANEMDQPAGEEDPLKRDLGWTSDEDETDDASTTDGEEESGQGEEEDTSAQDGSDKEEDGETEDGSQEDSEEEGEETDAETGEEETEEDELFYDAERDYPDDEVPPTKYRDRIALNDGFAAKVRYARQIKEQLEELNEGLGAIQLPDYFRGDESILDQTVDRTAFANLDDESAKKAIRDMDMLIKSAKTKLSRVQTHHEQRQQHQQVSQEYQQEVQKLGDALSDIGLNVDEAKNMSMADIIAKADEAIAELEDEEFSKEFIEKKGPQAWRQEIEKYESAKKVVERFPEVSQKYQEQQQKSGKQANQIDPQKVESSYEGFKQDRPDHAVFEGHTEEREEAFLEWAKKKIEDREVLPPDHERKWLSLADKYVKEIEDERKAYEQRRKKSSPASQGKKGVKDSNTADDSPVDKKKQPPSSAAVNNNRSRRDVLTTRDIDNELDQLAREM